MAEFVVQFLVWGVLAVIGAGVVVAVSTLLHRPRLTRALVTGENSSITLLAGPTALRPTPALSDPLWRRTGSLPSLSA
jgi:hypothetical protein